MYDNRRKRHLLVIAGLAIAALSPSCISPQLLQDKEDEIAALREERTRLKKDLRDKDREIETMEIALMEASMRPEIEPVIAVPAATPDYPGLEDLGIGTEMRGRDLVISIPSEITFASGRADLSSGGKTALREVARTLSGDYGGHSYWIEGHTDSDPISKAKFESNRALSVARAMSVLHYLVEECGTPDEQCKVVGHGEYEPIASNSGSTKSRNRRVEIVVHAPATP